MSSDAAPQVGQLRQPVAVMPPPRRPGMFRKNGYFIASLMPAAILLSIFFIGPALWGIYASFTNKALVGIDAANPAWVGLDNYRQLFQDPDFTRVLKNSLVFVVGSAMIGQFILGLALSLLIDHAESRQYRVASVGYAAVVLAWVNPTLIASFLWVAMFDYYYGSLNEALTFFGFHSVDWLGRAPMLAVIIVNIWRGTAFTMLIFLGALKTIPSDIYEAARVDGANAWHRFWDHTLPNLRYISMLVLLTITIETFGTFILIQTLTNGGPGLKTEVIALYAYHAAFQNYQIGYGSTIAVVMLAINFFFAIFYLRVARPETS